MNNPNLNNCQNYFIWILCAQIYFLDFSRIFLSAFAKFYCLFDFPVFSKLENLKYFSDSNWAESLQPSSLPQRVARVAA